MSWGDWMVVEFSIEEELQIESQARTVLHCGNTAEVARLCSSLVKQNAYYTKLLRQATGHIAQLEMEAFLAEEAKLQCASGGSDQSHQDDIQGQNLFLELLLIVLSFAVSCAFAVQRLWQRVKPAKTPKPHD
jgi:hypothetical protein